jgi:hypothetical protein
MPEQFFTLPAWEAPAPYQHRYFGQRFLNKDWQEYMQIGMNLINDTPLMFSPMGKKVSKNSPDYESPNDFYWRLETSHALQKPNLQQKLITCAKTEEGQHAIKTLFHHYHRHGRFAHFQSTALLSIAKNVLPPLLKRIKLAQAQVNHWFFRLIMPKTFFNAYNDYLFELEHEMKKIHHECLNAMLIRVQLALGSVTLQYDDVLMDFIYSCRISAPHFISQKQLRADKEKNFTRSLPQHPSQRLTKKRLLEMLHIIRQQGSNQQQQALSALLNDQNQLHFITHNKHIALTTPSIARRLQAVSHYPQRLHRSYVVLKQLCSTKNSFYLLCSQILQKKLDEFSNNPDFIDSHEGLHPKIFTHLQGCQNFFEQHIAAVDRSVLNGVWNFLDRGKTNHALDTYHTYLVQNQLSLLHVCIRLLNTLMTKLPEKKETLKQSHRVSIENLLSHSLQYAEKIQHNAASREELKTIQKKWQAYCSTHHPEKTNAKEKTQIPSQTTIDQLSLLIQKLPQGNPLPKNEYAQSPMPRFTKN